MNEKKNITFILFRNFSLLIQLFYQRAQMNLSPIDHVEML